MRSFGLSGSVIAAVAVAAVAGCSSGASAPAQGGIGVTVEVEAGDNVFRSADLTVKAGTTVKWTNVGRNNHDVTPVEGGWGVALAEFGPDTAHPGVHRARHLPVLLFGARHEERRHDRHRHGRVTVPLPETATLVRQHPRGETMNRITSRASRSAIAILTLGAMAVTTVSCGSDGGSSGATLNVPDDFATIQEAVDSAKPGDLVLIAPGTYNEAVDVTTDDLTIRGLDRNTVILDGNFELTNGIKVVGADGVAIENMTGRNYTSNSFYWTGSDGYRASYLTSYRTGDYGIYAFDSVHGQIEHSYASGSRDAGIYIGQCYPCDAVIDDVISEWNGLGYSGTNSGGNLIIVNSTWRYNRAGIVPNTGSYELCYPERETTIVGNIVYENQNPDTPAIDVALLAMGNGILVAGGIGNVVERNLVYDHERTGIGVVPFPEEGASDVPSEDESLLAVNCEDAPAPTVAPEDIPDLVLWSPKNNRIVGNSVSGSGIADIAVGDLQPDLAALNNCFSDNVHSTSAPENLETLAPCDGTGSGDWAKGSLDLVTLIASSRPPEKDWKTTPEPPEQPNMPNAAKAKAESARSMPRKVDLAAIKLPSKP